MDIQLKSVHCKDCDRAIYGYAQHTSTQWARMFFLLSRLNDVQQWGYKLDEACAELEVPNEA